MIRATSTWLALALAGTGLMCGCGGGSTSTTTISAAGGAGASGAAGAAVAATGAASVAGGSGSGSASSAKAASSSPTSAQASASGAWNPIQCGQGLRELIKNKGASNAAQLHAYKQALKHQHGCYTAQSRIPTPTSSVPVWNALRCSAALDQYVKTSKPTAAGLRAYKVTLRTQHGCYTAASLNPKPAPAPPKHKG